MFGCAPDYPLSLLSLLSKHELRILRALGSLGSWLNVKRKPRAFSALRDLGMKTVWECFRFRF